MVFQDSVALDLCGEDGEYDPGFDSHVIKSKAVSPNSNFNFEDWYQSIAHDTLGSVNWHGIN